MESITQKLIKYDLSERLAACLKMEVLCADVYHTLVSLFPESLFPDASKLFETLAVEEERHADIIAIGIEYDNVDLVPEIIVPSELHLIHETLRIAEDIKARIDAERVNVKTALGMILKMEESTAESYLRDVMTKTTDSEVISYLKKFYKDEQSHAEMIREFM